MAFLYSHMWTAFFFFRIQISMWSRLGLKKNSTPRSLFYSPKRWISRHIRSDSLGSEMMGLSTKGCRYSREIHLLLFNLEQIKRTHVVKHKIYFSAFDKLFRKTFPSEHIIILCPKRLRWTWKTLFYRWMLTHHHRGFQLSCRHSSTVFSLTSSSAGSSGLYVCMNSKSITLIDLIRLLKRTFCLNLHKCNKQISN